MKRVIAVLAMAMAAACSMAQQPQAQKKMQKPAAASKSAATQDPGAKAFQANCSRCHSAPEQIRRSISHTVLMHMRVRASLSEADEKALLQFLAP